ncbi:protein Flattop [Gadus chalcogrammus]|uniref:protein Flattop n=1 Tax=Gadus chalcogrammus TaxID=1042646 RepID=UPI0024C436B1|nr:protein Flattop [Gadus chalcogrammus]
MQAAADTSIMSSNYSANQYESSYKSQRLQNWCVSKPCRQRPTALEGHTTFIADDRGHLMPGVSKRGSSWPAFKGTWDLPARLPPQGLNPTSRSVEGWNRLQALHGGPKRTRTTQPQEGSKDTPHQAEHDAPQDCSATNPTPPPPAQSQEPPGCSGVEGPPSKEGRQPLHV